jgi:magnesium transporter
MLKVFEPPATDANASKTRPRWIDLFNPTLEESARVKDECGIEIPTRQSLQEIETSSRLRAEEDSVLYVSMPLALQDAADDFRPVPLGFILSPKFLVTIRYSEIQAFSQLTPHLSEYSKADSAAVFAALIAGMVDFNADMIEKLSGDLSAVSARVFGHHGQPPPRDKHFTRALRHSLDVVGHAGDHLSRIRESLLGLQRIIMFVSKSANDWLLPESSNNLKTARRDIVSLVDFEAHLSGKTQFLLDAILGFINTEQNDIFKVLTIVSVVGIPPTLIASMYGMNFHDMPELAWRFGYPYGLTLIALSILVPIVWFRRRGWW